MADRNIIILFFGGSEPYLWEGICSKLNYKLQHSDTHSNVRVTKLHLKLTQLKLFEADPATSALRHQPTSCEQVRRNKNTISDGLWSFIEVNLLQNRKQSKNISSVTSTILQLRFSDVSTRTKMASTPTKYSSSDWFFAIVEPFSLASRSVMLIINFRKARMSCRNVRGLSTE